MHKSSIPSHCNSCHSVICTGLQCTWPKIGNNHSVVAHAKQKRTEENSKKEKIKNLRNEVLEAIPLFHVANAFSLVWRIQRHLPTSLMTLFKGPFLRSESKRVTASLRIFLLHMHTFRRAHVTRDQCATFLILFLIHCSYANRNSIRNEKFVWICNHCFT